MRLFSRKAQATIEYALIGTLVIASVLIMGPEVIRSINAYFKGMEDEVEDSFREDMEQSPLTNFPVPECNCTGLVDSGVCGNDENCTRYERVFINTCTPVGCEVDLIGFGVNVQMMDCVGDPRCCNDWISTGKCGANADTANGGFTDGGCDDGTLEYYRFCGPDDHDPYPPPALLLDGIEFTCSNEPECCDDPCAPANECIEYPPVCNYGCEGDYYLNPVTHLPDGPADPPGNTTWCGIGDEYKSELLSDTNITYVAIGACTGAKCEAQCITDRHDAYNVPPVGCRCPTGLGFVVVDLPDGSTSCECDAGGNYFWVD